MLKKQRRIHNTKYLDWIRSCPCIVCLMESKGLMNTADNISEPHHVNKVGEGTMGGKTDDSRTIPLCNKHHKKCHQKGRDTFSNLYNLDLEYTITRLNKIWEELNEIRS